MTPDDTARLLTPEGLEAIRTWVVAGIAASAIRTDGEREALPWVLSGGLERALTTRDARPAPDATLREAAEWVREFAQHRQSCIFAVDLSGINGDEWQGDNARRCNCGFDDALAALNPEATR